MTEVELIQKLNEFRSLPSETEVVEFKTAGNDYDFKKIGIYFSALSNEANLNYKSDAWLIFGIDNKHKNIVGSNYRAGNREGLDRLKHEIANKTTNGITFIEIYELNLPEGRVLMFRIPPAPRGIPVAWEGHYYGRNGESLVALNIEEFERIRKQEIQIDWSAKICMGATLNDLDPDAILSARENFKIKNPRIAHEVDQWTDDVFLSKAKITIAGKITNSTMLLLGKKESAHLILPAIAQVTWILKDNENIERDYEHFTMPLLINTSNILKKIRNLVYRYLPDNTLFPTEVTQYEPYVIREALHNCIAHQDYSLQQRINLVEFPEHLIFENAGSFIPVTIENVLEQDAPQRFYRNKFLCDAMVALNMIDTIGSGIKKMFLYQRNRFFPMPDFELSQSDAVKVKLFGKIIDKKYTQLLINKSNLSLHAAIMLDKVQKSKPISDDDARVLKSASLIEGRKPNYHISSDLAAATGQSVEYMKLKGIDDDFVRKTILEYLKKFGSTKRDILEKILLNKLSDGLSENKKKNKVQNILQSMRRSGEISPNGKLWEINRDKNV